MRWKYGRELRQDEDAPCDPDQEVDRSMGDVERSHMSFSTHLDDVTENTDHSLTNGISVISNFKMVDADEQIIEPAEMDTVFS